MDPNLEKIAEANSYAIRKGNIKKAIEQAEDYLSYMLGHNAEQNLESELQEFVAHVKEMRREARGQRQRKRTQEGQQEVQGTQASV